MVAAISITPFTEGELSDFVAAYNISAKASPYFFPIDEQIFRRAVLAKPYFDSKHLLLARCQGRPLGFIHGGFAGRSDGTGLDYEKGAIFGLFVAPGEKEVALMLLGAELERLTSAGVSEVIAWCHWNGSLFYNGIHGGSVNLCWEGYKEAIEAFEDFRFKRCVEEITLEYNLREPPALLHPDIEVEIKDEVVRLEEFTRRWANAEYDLCDFSAYYKGQWIGRCRYTLLKGLSMARGRRQAAIVGMRVEEGYRRKGIASTLISRTLHKLEKEAYEKVLVDTSRKNLPALGLYEKMGFRRNECAKWVGFILKGL